MINKKSVISLIISVAISLVVLITLGQTGKRPLVSRPAVQVTGKATFSVDVAQTPEQREKGLSNRTWLGPDQGMLFVFEKSAIQSFWNKDTFIPLDVIWIKSNRIVYLSTLPVFESGQTPVVITPSQVADLVLEVPAGTVTKHNIKIGDKVKEISVQ